MSTTVEPLPVGPLMAAALNTSVVVAALVAAWVLIHSRGVTWWARGRLVVALLLMAVANWIADVAGGGMATAALAGVLSMESALVLCVMAQSLLRRSMLAHEREVQELHETLAEARVAIRHERELLHEVGSTVAGITSATNLMGADQSLPLDRRQRLQHLVDLELARLERLMMCRAEAVVTTTGPVRAEAAGVDLDEIVERLVTSHRLRGLTVHWTPRGLRCAADPDDFAQVINILLENARRHGGGQVELDSLDDDDWVVVTCSDHGPGVDEAVRARIFESGVRASASPGQGLGLGIARRLVEQCGGDLVLADAVSPGATFVARLPKKEMSRVAAHGA
ncbi:HAMP domain-containing histidine kinase [Nocardioides anomalus]|uniref:histidine kinase n=1 Tax=Nocardioides anomalus TaxID=2712223 RepID=A0A6G6WGP3_9ACTN|nr:HAMP domain-containing sensor histidine kinase [Nocardioides anomalus]QIG44404.1 HAMP domain-containing histidine kinase [Nocardioides anomalus]